MIRALALCLFLAGPAAAQDLGCPVDVHTRLFGLGERAGAGEIGPEELGQEINTLTRACGNTREILGQIVAAFTAAGLAVEPPEPARFGAHLQAFRAGQALARGGAGGFAPLSLGARDWTEADERNAWWDLMFAMAADFLVFGAHADIYTPGRTEQVGCGLYPAEEASALATLAADNADGGELVARVHFLGSECDTQGRDTSGAAAAYFAAHKAARATDPDYLGLTASDIRSGLARFLAAHLDGRDESAMFTPEQVKKLQAE